ncbi:hypothetical protein J6590_012850 [Homalodisca vitripennis]|nr:hypothetical protein J6590_012850 [Homalodisca vitripennis]
MPRYVTWQMSRTVHTATDVCHILGHCFSSVSRCSAISPHDVSFKFLSLYSSKSVFHSSGRVLTASINCSTINNKNSNPASCKELQHESARQVWSCARWGCEPVRMREATDVDRCFEKIALGAIPQIRLSTSVMSVRFCEVDVHFTPPPTSVRYCIVSALSVGLVTAGNMASGSWCDSAFTKNVPWLDDGDSSSSSEEELMLLYSVTNRMHWVHPINQRWEQCGEYHHLMKDLELDDDRFTTYSRLSKPEYEEILTLTCNDISKKDTNYTRCFYSRERLALCLSCSAISPHAVSFKFLSLYSFKSVFHSIGCVLKASINCSIINNKNSNPAACKELQHKTARHAHRGVASQCACARPQTSTDVLKRSLSERFRRFVCRRLWCL